MSRFQFDFCVAEKDNTESWEVTWEESCHLSHSLLESPLHVFVCLFVFWGWYTWWCCLFLPVLRDSLLEVLMVRVRVMWCRGRTQGWHIPGKYLLLCLISLAIFPYFSLQSWGSEITQGNRGNWFLFLPTWCFTAYRKSIFAKSCLGERKHLRHGLEGSTLGLWPCAAT